MAPLPDTVMALLGAALFWIAMNTIVHPFILADNRHYTFYVFRILMHHPAIKYLAAPVYLSCGWAALSAFGSRTSTTLVWLLASSMSLVTAPLVEPRYFLIPWIVWRIHVSCPEPRKHATKNKGADQDTASESKLVALLIDNALWLETVWLLAVNVATGYIFLKWTFEWPREPGSTMRFMW